MHEVINEIRKKIKNVDNTAYSGKYKEGYIAGLTDAVEIMEDHIMDLLIVGNKYYLIAYENNDKYLPYIEEVLLSKAVKTAKRTTYHFTKNLDIKNIYFAESDYIIGKSSEILKRVFLHRETAEEYLK